MKHLCNHKGGCHASLVTVWNSCTQKFETNHTDNLKEYANYRAKKTCKRNQKRHKLWHNTWNECAIVETTALVDWHDRVIHLNEEEFCKRPPTARKRRAGNTRNYQPLVKASWNRNNHSQWLPTQHHIIFLAIAVTPNHPKHEKRGHNRKLKPRLNSHVLISQPSGQLLVSWS